MTLPLMPKATAVWLIDKTALTFTHADLRSEASEKSHAQGWTGALDKLVRHLEKNAAATTNFTREQLR